MLTILFFIGCVSITLSVVGFLFRALLFPVKLGLALLAAFLMIPLFLVPVFAVPFLFLLAPLNMVFIAIGIGYLIGRRCTI